ncbi:hypothetical protein EV424DRAFT_1348099 [Suillus variegatus]|nr:hypothetical protein EV424DRAFT_1348099 [Suillus variegatus]
MQYDIFSLCTTDEVHCQYIEHTSTLPGREDLNFRDEWQSKFQSKLLSGPEGVAGASRLALLMPNPQGKNGRGVVSPPDAIIRPLVEQYVANGYSNQEIISHLRAHQETSKFNISLSLLKKRRSQWGVTSACGQAHTIESIGPAIERVQSTVPQTGLARHEANP